MLLVPNSKRILYNSMVSQNNTPIPLEALLAPFQDAAAPKAINVSGTAGKARPVGHIDADHPDTAAVATTKKQNSIMQNTFPLGITQENTANERSRPHTATTNTLSQPSLPAKNAMGALMATISQPPNRAAEIFSFNKIPFLSPKNQLRDILCTCPVHL